MSAIEARIILVYCYRKIRGETEDLDARVLLDRNVLESPFEERATAVTAVERACKSHRSVGAQSRS